MPGHLLERLSRGNVPGHLLERLSRGDVGQYIYIYNLQTSTWKSNKFLICMPAPKHPAFPPGTRVTRHSWRARRRRRLGRPARMTARAPRRIAASSTPATPASENGRACLPGKRTIKSGSTLPHWSNIIEMIFAFFTFDLYPIREILVRAIASRRDPTCTTDFGISSFPVANPKCDI